jgi:hypothetical protein
VELDKAILQLFPDVNFNFGGDVSLSDDGDGPYISAWNRPEPQPTPAELDAAWVAWEAGQPARDAAAQILIDAAAFEGLPEWAGYTTQEAIDAIHAAIGSGKSAATMKADIDALPNTVAGMKTAFKALIDDVIVPQRAIIEKMAKLIVYLRDRTG